MLVGIQFPVKKQLDNLRVKIKDDLSPPSQHERCSMLPSVSLSELKMMTNNLQIHHEPHLQWRKKHLESPSGKRRIKDITWSELACEKVCGPSLERSDRDHFSADLCLSITYKVLRYQGSRCVSHAFKPKLLQGKWKWRFNTLQDYWF